MLWCVRLQLIVLFEIELHAEVFFSVGLVLLAVCLFVLLVVLVPSRVAAVSVETGVSVEAALCVFTPLGLQWIVTRSIIILVPFGGYATRWRNSHLSFLSKLQFTTTLAD